MALLSYSSAPAKGATSTATMDKSVLTALPSVSSDAYWADQLNTKTVIITFKSSSGNQKRVLTFDFSLASPSADLSFPSRCRSEFTIAKIVMVDYLGDKLSISSPGLNDDNLTLA